MEQTIKAGLVEGEASVGKALQQSGRKRKSPIRLSVPIIYILVAVALVIFITLNILTFNGRAFEIPSGAMEPTLLIGDHIFVKPHHLIKEGDILVFVSPVDPKIYSVKRVVGIPGDRIHLRDSEWKLTMPQHIENGDIVVPPDSYFGMGDNRDVSYDSRYWGFIPKENIIGRPMFIYWSFETPADQYLHKAMSQRFSFLAHVVIHFFDKTRWKRTFKVQR